MSSKAIVCTACSAAVPYGRLSCPACGELLASVAGAVRSAVATAPTKRASRAARPTPSVLVDVAPVTELPETELPEPVSFGWDAAPAQDRPLDDAALDLSVARSGPAFVEPTTFTPSSLEPSSTDEGPAWDRTTPDWPEAQTQWREARQTPMPAPVMVTSPSLANAPGAYVPPMLPGMPAGPPAPARAWAGQPAGDPVANVAGAASTSSSSSSADSLVDPARLTEFMGWLAAAGSAMAAVGFLLPWGISVIGATGVDYVDRWGMAGPFHPLVVLGVLALLGLALVPNRIPLWIRVGLPGLGLGALLLGLVWPYMLYLPGKGPGVVVVALGAIILLAAGIAALVADRHASEHRAV